MQFGGGSAFSGYGSWLTFGPSSMVHGVRLVLPGYFHGVLLLVKHTGLGTWLLERVVE